MKKPETKRRKSREMMEKEIEDKKNMAFWVSILVIHSMGMFAEGGNG